MVNIPHISEILSFITGLASGSLLTFKITKSIKMSDGSKIIDQRKAKSGGDIIGGDKTTIT